MKQLFLTFIFAVFVSNCFSQGSISTIFKDESNGLNVLEGTTMVNDASANGGTCIFRPAEAANNTVWFGPYISVAAGNYLMQARLKVSSNSSSSALFILDVVSQAGGVVHGRLSITPNMFKANNEWQLISIPVSIPNGVTNVEIRGISFQSGITDIYFDYAQLIPSSLLGLYSTELTISGKGDVGIGTTTPHEKLSVNGKIRAHEIKVETTSWPDYVFEEGYKVEKLEELESYIKTNKRLPEMPSAKEVAENGVQLGEMNKLLLKKVEELTLHLIEKDKQLQHEDLAIKEQQRKIDALEKSHLELKQQLELLINKKNK